MNLKCSEHSRTCRRAIGGVEKYVNFDVGTFLPVAQDYTWRTIVYERILLIFLNLCVGRTESLFKFNDS